MSHLSYMEKLLDGVEVEWKPLGEVARFINGRAYKKPELLEQGKYPVLRVGNFFTNANWYYSDLELDEDKYCDNGDLLYAWSASFGPRIWEGGKVIYHYHIWKVIPNAGQILKKFLFYLLEWDTKALQGEHATGSTMMHVSKGAIESRLVPIPCPDNPEKSLAIQAEIVRILDAFTAMTAELTAELNMRKKQYNYYRDQLLSFKEGEVEWKSLEFLCKSISAGGDVPKNSAKGQTEPTSEYPYPIYANATDEKGLYGFTDNYKIDSDAVTISARGAKVGYHTVREAKFTPIIRLIVLVADKNLVTTRYLNYVLDMTPIGGTEGGIPQLTVPMVKKITVPIPFPNDPEKSLVEQTRIVAVLDKFDTLTTSLQEGLPREIELRQKQYEYYRNLLLSFPACPAGGPKSDEAA